MASTRNSHHRACRVTQPSQNGSAEPYEALFQSPGIPDLTLNGHADGSRISNMRRLDPKLRARAKNLLTAIKDEKYVHDFNDSLVERRDVLIGLRAIAKYHRRITDVDFAEMKETLADVNIEDLSILLRQVLLSMERYIPRTNQNPGTAQSLKDSHSHLVEKITSVVALYWSISQTLECHQTDGMMVNIRACFQNFVGILKFLPVTVQIPVMRLLTAWCDHFNIFVIGPQAAEMVARELPSVCRAAGDFEQQWLLGSLLGHVWNADQKLIEDFACASGLRTCLPEFCQLFRSENPSDLSRLPGKIVEFLNERKGIHRRVFSFPILGSSGCRMSVPGENQPLERPHASEPRSESLAWLLHFSTSSALISLEIPTVDQRVAVVKIPASAVVSVEASVEKSSEVAIVSLYLEDSLESYIAEDFSGFELGSEIGVCDRLSFRLQISGCHQVILLEKALELFFLNRKSDVCDIDLWSPFVRRKELSGVSERGLEPGVPRKLRGDCYRQVLCEVKLLGKTGLYEGRPESEILSQEASQVEPPLNGNCDKVEDGAVSALDLPPGAIVLDQPPATTSGVFFLVPGPDGKPLLLTFSNVMAISTTTENESMQENFSGPVESGKETITVDD